MLGEFKSEIKELLQTVLGPLFDPVMSSVGIFVPFLYPGALYWVFLLSALLIALGMYVAEARRAKQASVRGFFRYLAPKEVYKHPSAWLDLKFYVINSLVHQHLRLASFAFLVGGSLSVGYGAQQALVYIFGPGPAGVEPSWITKAAYTLAIVAAADLSKWYTHYLQHRIQFLWEFHKVHHSAEVLTPLTNLRVHPVDVMCENFLSAIVTGLVIGLYGYWYSSGVVEITIMGIAAVYFFALIFVNLRHSHLAFGFGAQLSKLFCSPAMHHFHHSAEARHFNKNFSVVFSLWDYLAGTIYIPKPGERPAQLGIGEESGEFNSVRALYLRPFLACTRRVRHLMSARA